jgi:hypothetical protein
VDERGAAVVVLAVAGDRKSEVGTLQHKVSGINHYRKQEREGRDKKQTEEEQKTNDKEMHRPCRAA